jgi:hypothetical protein
MQNWKTTAIGYGVAALTAAGTYLQANGDWAHLNWFNLLGSVGMVIWGHVQADAASTKK